MIEHLRQYAVVRAFLEAAALGDREAYLASLDALDWPTAWIEIFHAVVALGRVHPNTRAVFAEQWIGLDDAIPLSGPNGVYLSGKLEGRLDLLVAGLRILLPPVEGKAPRIIYRGQSVSAYENGIIGLCWTPLPMVAECYARLPSINPEPCLVLAQLSPEKAIIGQVSPTELIVDPRLIHDPHVLTISPRKFEPRSDRDGLFSQCETRTLDGIFEPDLGFLGRVAGGKGLGAAALPAPSP